MKTNVLIRRMARIAGGIAFLYALASGILLAGMYRNPGTFAQMMKHVPWPMIAGLPFKPLWNLARNGPLHRGDIAPDFALEQLNSKDTFRLSSLRGQKPVVLVFGSYT